MAKQIQWAASRIRIGLAGRCTTILEYQSRPIAIRENEEIEEKKKKENWRRMKEGTDSDGCTPISF